MRRTPTLLLAALTAVTFASCSPVEPTESSVVDEPAASSPAADPTDATSESASTEPGAVDPACGPDNPDLRQPGQLTVGTDKPAFEPWFSDNDPSNGKGYESAVAYAVADNLGFTADQLTWVTVPFNSSYKPGAKDFDFDINQISITPDRAEVVDFSDGYYSASQALIALKDSPAGSATSVAELADLNLGAQTGTTSLTALRELFPDKDPMVFEDTSSAKQAMLNGQVDGVVADLPTAFYITAVEIQQAGIVGQFAFESGEGEQFGMLFEKGSPLVDCVNQALAAMEADGTLAGIEQEWLSDVVDVPVLQ